ncbi:type II toxin-antitoxin system CcdA family antitoxin [Rhizobium sp. RCC_161_2]|uniref:type II toxin-antitoxin system CcdA family antitoxin n=1 Tax=Rhizobium sp. RCC_161_2 TaxID=3239219 RepID=UPI00352506AA
MVTHATRRSANLTLNKDILSEARELGINISRAAEDGLSRAIRSERERRWRAENAEAIADANAYIENHGLPLAKYRQF